MRTMPDDGACHELTMIDIESLPLWLVMTHPGEVAPGFRLGLIQFQDEANAVLSAWFPARSLDWLASAEGPGGGMRPGTRPRPRRKKARTRVAPSRLMLDHHEDGIVEFEAALRPLGHCRDLAYTTIREFCDRHGMTNSQGQPLSDEELAEIEPRLEAMSAALGIPVRKL